MVTPAETLHLLGRVQGPASECSVPSSAAFCFTTGT
jgi:hypothetical protein